MESKLPNILIILIVFAIFVFAVFYTFGSPIREKIKNISCNLLNGKIFELKLCEKVPTPEEIQKQTQQAQLQNVQNTIKVLSSQLIECGKTDPNLKCRCTYDFGAIGTNPIIILKSKDQIIITTSSGKSEKIDFKEFYYDDKKHYLDDNHKLNEGDEIILERNENLKKFSVKILRKGQPIQDAELYESYSILFDKDKFSVFLNNIGLFRDVNKIGLYLPKEKLLATLSDELEEDKLKECVNLPGTANPFSPEKLILAPSSDDIPPTATSTTP